MSVYQTGIVLNLLLKFFYGLETVQVTISCTRYQLLVSSRWQADCCQTIYAESLGMVARVITKRTPPLKRRAT